MEKLLAEYIIFNRYPINTTDMPKYSVISRVYENLNLCLRTDESRDMDVVSRSIISRLFGSNLKTLFSSMINTVVDAVISTGICSMAMCSWFCLLTCKRGRLRGLVRNAFHHRSPEFESWHGHI